MPLAIRLAWTAGFLDHPEARKLHTSATALLGGAAIVLVALGASLAGGVLDAAIGRVDARGVLGGAVLVLAVGLWDDRFGMQPVAKMVGQVLAAMLLLGSGALPDLRLGPTGNVVASLVVLVALMNAVNFLDNMNGVVAGLSAIALAAFAWGSAGRGETGLAVVQLALAGGCAAFLCFNFPRARIFLGDAGSLFLGYCLGASAALAFEGGPRGWGQLGPVLMLAYPAFDMIFVVATRVRDGRKVSQGGTDHSNHRLARILGSQTRTVLVLWLCGAVLSVSGLVVQRLNHPLPSLLLSALWILLFMAAWRRLAAVPIAASPPPATRP
jgi:UDP-GlcNAc:undecaprenyl-phosphate GlcNAc-1-phosphate transferase